MSISTVTPRSAENNPALCGIKPEFVAEDGTFNPYRGICGFYPPDVIARRTDFTDGHKRVFERLVRWAGRQGTVFGKSEADMARDLGMPKRTFQRHLAVIEARGLIQHRRLFQEANVYTFVWHPIYQAEFSLQGAPPMAHTDQSQDAPPVALSDAPPMAQELGKDVRTNQQQSTNRVSSSAFEKGRECMQAKGQDDDTLANQTQPQEPDVKPNSPMKAKPTPALPGITTMTPEGEEMQWDLEQIRLELQKTATLDWAGNGQPDLFPLPDLEITGAIVQAWTGKEIGFCDWLLYARERRLCDKRKGPGYALFLKDSQMHAAMWSPQRLLSKKFQFASALARNWAEMQECERRARERGPAPPPCAICHGTGRVHVEHRGLDAMRICSCQRRAAAAAVG